MSKITYNLELMNLMNLFEKVTRTRVKDCFIDESNESSLLTFVVQDYDVGRAIGKQAANVKHLESMLKKRVRILGFNNSPVQFVKGLIYPVQDAEIELSEGTIIIKAKDAKTKGFLIGRNQSALKNNLDIVQKYFKDVHQIKII
ncbi:MAG: NusA-like transcription termination signal-binding factor [Nanoarchaeota archaeon]|nr:NusA-like transcription termination signal-binding factor [Nanoarchaeota archaeon]